MKYFMMVFDKGDEYDIEHAESYLYNRKKFKILADVYYRQKLYLKLQHLIEEMVFAEERFTPKIIDFIEKAGEHFNEKCHPFLKSYYKLLKSKVDIMELHFNYSEQGKGFEDAKKDFYEQIAH